MSMIDLSPAMWAVAIGGVIGAASLLFSMMILALPYWAAIVIVAAIGTAIGDALGNGWVGLTIGAALGIAIVVVIAMIQFKRIDERDRQAQNLLL